MRAVGSRRGHGRCRAGEGWRVRPRDWEADFDKCAATPYNGLLGRVPVVERALRVGAACSASAGPVEGERQAVGRARFVARARPASLTRRLARAAARIGAAMLAPRRAEISWC